MLVRKTLTLTAAACLTMGALVSGAVGETGWRRVEVPPSSYAWRRGPPTRVFYHDSLRGYCQGASGRHRYTVGCAIRSGGRCTIHLLRGAPREVLAHEKAHCKGWTH
jgi:hypothetical protein